MADSYSTRNGIIKLEVGANDGTWGTEENANSKDVIDEALSGILSVSVTAGNATLAINNGAAGGADEARNPLIILTGTPGTARTLTLPDIEGLHWIVNNSDSTVTVGAGGGTTVALLAGVTAKIYTDGATNVGLLERSKISGTWTPALTFGGGSTGITYDAQTGTYTIVGDRCFYSLLIDLSSKGSSTGAAAVSMPFTHNEFYAVPAMWWESINLSAGYTAVTAFHNAATILLYEQGDNVAAQALTDAAFANGSVLHISGHYKL